MKQSQHTDAEIKCVGVFTLHGLLQLKENLLKATLNSAYPAIFSLGFLSKPAYSFTVILITSIIFLGSYLSFYCSSQIHYVVLYAILFFLISSTFSTFRRPLFVLLNEDHTVFIFYFVFSAASLLLAVLISVKGNDNSNRCDGIVWKTRPGLYYFRHGYLRVWYILYHQLSYFNRYSETCSV